MIVDFETVQTVSFVLLWDLNDGCFFSITRFQRRSVLFHYKILKTVGFVLLQDLDDGWFYSFSFQRLSVCFHNEILSCFVKALKKKKKKKNCDRYK